MLVLPVFVYQETQKILKNFSQIAHFWGEECTLTIVLQYFKNESVRLVSSKNNSVIIKIHWNENGCNCPPQGRWRLSSCEATGNSQGIVRLWKGAERGLWGSNSIAVTWKGLSRTLQKEPQCIECDFDVGESGAWLGDVLPFRGRCKQARNGTCDAGRQSTGHPERTTAT